jgi:hypothetical protein
MKTIIIILGILVVIIGISVGVLFFISPKSPTPSQTNSNPFGSATSGNTQPTQGGTQTSAEIPVTLENGGTVNVPDFTRTTTQLPSSSATNGYQVAGSPNGGPGGTGYDIIYFPSQSYFDISILSEPIGKNRLTAETALVSKLGLSKSQLCKLDVGVYVQVGVNDQYPGQNLGLSFCPGAIQLP